MAAPPGSNASAVCGQSGTLPRGRRFVPYGLAAFMTAPCPDWLDA